MFETRIFLRQQISDVKSPIEIVSVSTPVSMFHQLYQMLSFNLSI